MRKVIEREWVVQRCDARDDVALRVQREAMRVGERMRNLATGQPTYLEEVPLSVMVYEPDATGRTRIRVHGVMNTRKGLRLIILPGGQAP